MATATSSNERANRRIAVRDATGGMRGRRTNVAVEVS